MLTSKQRAAFRAQANGLDTTLIVGKDGITENLIGEADRQLTARELVKGRVLENAMLSPREACDAICEATGADGVAIVGTKFVLYRFSEKKQAERNSVGRAKASAKQENPVRKGAQARRRAAQAERERRNAYFRKNAIEQAIAREKEKARRREEQ